MEVVSNRPINSLPLSPHLLDTLQNAGFSVTSELQTMSAMELARELQCETDIAAKILHAVSSTMLESETGFTALDILKQTSQEVAIITFCKSIDRMLGGGIPCGQITEICGVPGVGKTQLGIQLAVDVQIPGEFKGRGGQAVYIDTEGSFMVERAAEVADAVTKHLSRIAAHCPPESPKALAASLISQDSLLQGIHVFRSLDQTELLATLHHLPSFLTAHPDVKLLVVDSIAFHFRQDLQDLPARTRVLGTVSQSLNKCLAIRPALSIVVVNHVTTRLDRVSGRSAVVPALGDAWTQSLSHRLMLQWKAGQRAAYLVKSPDRPCGSALFNVTALGVRDVAGDQLLQESQFSQNGGLTQGLGRGAGDEQREQQVLSHAEKRQRMA